MELTLERAKELLVTLIKDIGSNHLGGEPIDVADTINYLFTLDFTEEEILSLEIFTEEDIDLANELNLSNI